MKWNNSGRAPQHAAQTLRVALISSGLLDTLLVHPARFPNTPSRQRLRPVLGHNHPAGTRRLPKRTSGRRATFIPPGNFFKKIEVLDHVILGRRTAENGRDYASLRELVFSTPSRNDSSHRHHPSKSATGPERLRSVLNVVIDGMSPWGRLPGVGPHVYLYGPYAHRANNRSTRMRGGEAPQESNIMTSRRNTHGRQTTWWRKGATVHRFGQGWPRPPIIGSNNF